MADMSRLSPFGFLFGKGLSDLIHGIRRCNSPDEQTEFLAEVINECREEVCSTNLSVKTTAVLKLAYLEMLGYDMAWSGFHVVEVMASPRFQQKRIGYIAAMQSFRGDQELLMLVTNLLKMDLVNHSTATVGIALSGLATIVSPLLASDVADDIMRMLSHSNAYIRKKAVLALHNVVLQYPEVLPIALQRIGDMLDVAQQDPGDIDNVSVVSATVSVICELATHSTSVHDFLELTPKLYAIFNSSQHNWTLIKLLKIFRLFTKREPRLKTRLLPTIRSMMTSSEATSLVYESANCIVQGGMVDSNDYELAREIIDCLQAAAKTRDANLTLIFAGVLDDLAQLNAEFVSADLVATMLTDQQVDPVTRRRVLRLAELCVSDDTLFDFVTELLRQFHLEVDRDVKLDISTALSNMVAANTYEYVPDFEWLIQILDEITKEVVPTALSRRLLDIAVRIPDPDVRNSVSELCRNWLIKASNPASDFAIRENEDHSSSSNENISLFAETCWWIIGEFPSSEMLADPLGFVQSLSSATTSSPAVATSVSKFVTKASNVDNQLLDAAINFLTPLSHSTNFELQERSCEFLELLKLARTSPEQTMALLYNGLASLFSAYELMPIAPGSQQQVGNPANLDLDTPVLQSDFVNEDDLLLLDESSEDEENTVTSADSYCSREITPQVQPVLENSEDDEAAEKARQRREQESQLFNLANLETRQRERPVKKKVQIMKDSTPVVDSNPQVSVNRRSSATSFSNSSQPSSSKFFKSGFSRNATLILDSDPSPPAETEEPPPVKVKHKKKKKASKTVE